MIEWFFWIAAAPVILFVAIYAVAARWWTTDAGRQTMALSVALLALVVIGVLRRYYGEHPFAEIGRLIAYTFVSVALWWRLILLIRVQIHARWKEES